MKLVSSVEMQSIDSTTINQFKIPGLILMENAGRLVADWLIQKKLKKNDSVAILCGSGNNGGDGFVAARHLHRKGYNVIIALLANPQKIKGDAAVNLQAAEQLGIKIHYCLQSDDFIAIASELQTCSLFVDALFGTGLNRAVTGFREDIIRTVNEWPIEKVAIDIPSGMLCNGEAQPNVILSVNHTLTIGLPKIGMQDWPGAAACGSIVLLDIGFPKQLLEDMQLQREWITPEWAGKMAPQRSETAYKGSMGRIAIIGGSALYQGAPRLAALGALHGGCGLVDLFVPASAGITLPLGYADIIFHAVPDNGNGFFCKESCEYLLKELSLFDAVVLGPGIGRTPETAQFLEKIISSIDLPLILDADALFYIAKEGKLLSSYRGESVCTPHLGEFLRLAQLKRDSSSQTVQQKAQQLSKKLNTTIVLKGAASAIFDSSGRQRWSRSGTPAMARGGMGDVLAGLIGAYIARKISPSEAAALAVFIHGLTGSWLEKEYGSDGVTAVRLAEAISKCSSRLQKRSGFAYEYAVFPELYDPLKNNFN